MPFDFERLKVYQHSLDFVDGIYEITHSFPRAEIMGITGQIRRAAVSIPLNVAEGSGRSKKEFMNYLGRARASIYECVSLLEIARRQKLIEAKQHEHFYTKCEELSKMLSGLLRSLVQNGHYQSVSDYEP